MVLPINSYSITITINIIHQWLSSSPTLLVVTAGYSNGSWWYWPCSLYLAVVWSVEQVELFSLSIRSQQSVLQRNVSMCHLMTTREGTSLEWFIHLSMNQYQLYPKVVVVHMPTSHTCWYLLPNLTKQMWFRKHMFRSIKWVGQPWSTITIISDDCQLGHWASHVPTALGAPLSSSSGNLKKLVSCRDYPELLRREPAIYHTLSMDS